MARLLTQLLNFTMKFPWNCRFALMQIHGKFYTVDIFQKSDSRIYSSMNRKLKRNIKNILHILKVSKIYSEKLRIFPINHFRVSLSDVQENLRRELVDKIIVINWKTLNKIYPDIKVKILEFRKNLETLSTGYFLEGYNNTWPKIVKIFI